MIIRKLIYNESGDERFIKLLSEKEIYIIQIYIMEEQQLQLLISID